MGVTTSKIFYHKKLKLKKCPYFFFFKWLNKAHFNVNKDVKEIIQIAELWNR